MNARGGGVGSSLLPSQDFDLKIKSTITILDPSRSFLKLKSSPILIILSTKRKVFFSSFYTYSVFCGYDMPFSGQYISLLYLCMRTCRHACVCLCVRMCVTVCVCLVCVWLVCATVCVRVCLLSTCTRSCPSIYLSICMCVCLSVHVHTNSATKVYKYLVMLVLRMCKKKTRMKTWK